MPRVGMGAHMGMMRARVPMIAAAMGGTATNTRVFIASLGSCYFAIMTWPRGGDRASLLYPRFLNPVRANRLPARARGCASSALAGSRALLSSRGRRSASGRCRS